MSADPFNPSTTPPPATSSPSPSPADVPIPASTPSSALSASSSPPPRATSPLAPSAIVPSTTTATPPPLRQERDGPVDERVTTLRGMFPDYDDLILQSVLESVNWSQDRAIDTLLGMSDPEYKPQTPQQPQFSQTELDEQLARRLVLEEQQSHQQWVQQQHQPQQPGVPYQARPGQQWIPQPQGQNQAQPGGGQGTGMQEISEQFNKLAETGKKTFGTLFSKVKAKIQEFDQPRPNAAGSSQPINQGLGPNHAWSQPQYPQTQSNQPSYYAPGPSPLPSTVPPASQNYVAPRSSPPAAVQGYDATPEPSLVPKPTSTTLSTSPPAANSSSTAAAATTAQPINAGKFGLLPKRPVSLLRETPPAEGAAAGAAGGSSSAVPPKVQPKPVNDGYDSDGLEYTENPFEETRK